MKDFMPIGGQFFMRKQMAGGVDVTIMLGVVHQNLITTQGRGVLKGGPGDELWLMNFIPVDVRKFRVPPEYGGWRADQILTSGLSVRGLEEIK